MPSTTSLSTFGAVMIGAVALMFFSGQLPAGIPRTRFVTLQTMGSQAKDRERNLSDILKDDFSVHIHSQHGRSYVVAGEIPPGDWAMRAVCGPPFDGYVYPLNHVPEVRPVYSFGDMPLLSALTPGQHSDAVYLGFIQGVLDPVAINMLPERTSEAELEAEFQKAQIGYLLGTSPKVYGVIRSADGLIGYAMGVFLGELGTLEPKLQEQHIDVIQQYNEIGLYPPSFLVTPERSLVYIDAGNAGVQDPDRYKQFLASKTPPAFPARGSLWPYLVARSISSAARHAWSVIISYLAMRDSRALEPGPKALVVFGSDLLKVAESAADFYQEHHPEFVLVSGGTGGRTGASGGQSEAERFADVLYARGVPFEKVLLEKEASNSGENARYSVQLLQQRGFSGKIVLMQKPTDQRRAGLTLRHELDKANMENVQVFDWAPFIPSLEDPLEGYSADEWSHRLFFDAIGEIFRLIDYPEKGFFAAEPVAAEVLSVVPALYDQLNSHPSIAPSQKQALQERWSVISSRSGLSAAIKGQTAPVPGSWFGETSLDNFLNSLRELYPGVLSHLAKRRTSSGEIVQESLDERIQWMRQGAFDWVGEEMRSFAQDLRGADDVQFERLILPLLVRLPDVRPKSLEVFFKRLIEPDGNGFQHHLQSPFSLDIQQINFASYENRSPNPNQSRLSEYDQWQRDAIKCQIFIAELIYRWDRHSQKRMDSGSRILAAA